MLSAAAVLALGLAQPAAAESLAASTASTASSAGSAAVGSLSDSVQGSSRSSAGDARRAAGDYRVIDMVAVAERPGYIALRLRREPDPVTPVEAAPLAERAAAAAEPAVHDAAADAEALELRLQVPAAALAARPLARGDRVVARARSYGLWFAQRASDGQDRPFFLALHADWQAELGSRAL